MELNIFFLAEFTYIFFPLEIKVSFFKPQKMYIFPTYSPKRNLRSHFLRKYLKALANKICDAMWEWEISTWRTEHSNHFPKGHHGCNLQCIWSYVLYLKISEGCVFIESLLLMLKTNDFDRAGSRTFIMLVPSPKEENFFVCSNHFEKIASNETFRWETLFLFPFSGYS